MKVIDGDLYYIKRISGKKSNMAERCFNAYKNVNSLCYAYQEDTSEITYYDIGAVLSEAKNGNLWAIYEVGFMIENGICFKMDLRRAFKWYEKGAKRGDSACQFALFYMYRLGKGVEINIYKAFFWLKLSAEGGNSMAMFHLGQFYIDGIIEEFNCSEALYWLEKSAKSGYSDAMLYLGIVAERGICESADMEKAYKWYVKAAELNNVDAHIQLAQLVFREFSSNQKYVKRAVHFLNKSIKMGNSNAFFVLGLYYKSLGGVYYKKAFELLKKSADKCDNILAVFEVAEMYEAGLGVEMDAEKAADYYYRVFNMV